MFQSGAHPPVNGFKADDHVDEGLIFIGQSHSIVEDMSERKSFKNSIASNSSDNSEEGFAFKNGV